MPQKLKNKKPIIAVYSLTCCEGCQIATLDLQEKFFDFIIKYFDVGNFPVIEDAPDVPEYDVALVEGTPVTKDNIEHLKKIRAKSKLLGALGNCATHGNIQKSKNYRDKDKLLSEIYSGNINGIDNIEIKPISAYVKVDFNIWGCPPHGADILRIFANLKEGNFFDDRSRLPVCNECIAQDIDCLLQRGQPCLGPVSRGGCEAVCPRAGYKCEGCRGILEKSDIKDLKKIFMDKKLINEKDLDILLEKYGIKEEWNERLK